MAIAVLGREPELAAIDDFLAGFPATAGALLLSGPAGIGKSTLWARALEAAQERGYRVVVSRPTEVETGLAFAGLNDLLGDLVEPALPALPEPQRVALEAALLRVAAGTPPHPLAVALAVVGVLRSAAEAQPLLLAVDDAPWLDEPSVRALDFALRRLEGVPVGVLAAQRTVEPEAGDPALLAAIPEDRLRRLAVGALSIDAIDRLLRLRLGVELARPVLVRLHGAAAGNPFYALELGRAMQRGARAGLDPLDVPPSLDRLVAERLGTLDATALDVALLVAAAAHPTTELLAAALGSDVARRGTTAAVRVGVLQSDGDEVRFSHPLLAVAAYARASAEERRAAHGRLAWLASEPEERARHLALTTTEPDEEVAAALEVAAVAVDRQGAPDAGAELSERAAELTPADERRGQRRRLNAAAHQHQRAGDIERARRLLQRLVDESETVAERTEALTGLAHLLLMQAEWDEAEALYRAAADIVDHDPRRRFAVEHGLAGLAYLTWRNWREGARHAEGMLRAAEELGDAVILLQALGHAATWRDVSGGDWRDLMARADATEGWTGDVETIEHPDLQFVRLLARAGEHDDARRRLERLRTLARERGDWHSLPRLLTDSIPLRVDLGDLDGAADDLAAALTGMQQTGEGAWTFTASPASLELDVLRGNVAAARAAEAQLRGLLASRPSLAWARWSTDRNAALLELSVGDPATAHAHLERYLVDPDDLPLPPNSRMELVALGVEALVALGRIGEARRLVDGWKRLHRLHARWIAAETERAEALVLASEGDVRAGLEAAERALELAEGTGMPFVLGRALLATGELRRRTRQKARAREALERAVEVFTRMGARLFVERARSELARVAVRRPEGAALTETEQQIVALVASGSTNREVADALFMSTHTVESHLTRIFRTLGVHGRTELARLAIESDLAGVGAEGARGSARGSGPKR